MNIEGCNMEKVKRPVVTHNATKVKALVSEEIVVPTFLVNGKEPEPFGELARVLIKLFANKEMTVRNRFRRLVPSERISRLSSMVFALTSEQAFNNYIE